MCVPPLPSTFEPFARVLTFSRVHDIEGDLDVTVLNLLASTNPKWRTFTLLR
jgi:hypothetical protein